MYATLVAGLTLLTGAAAEIAILYPSAGATWFMNGSVPLNWTLTQPETDPKEFRVVLSGGGMAGPQEIAQEIPSVNGQYHLSLPQLSPGDGYTIAFVNTTNEAQEYAKSNAFKIEQGTAPTSSQSSSAVASSTKATNNIPNVSSDPTSSSVNPFATSAGATANSGAAQIAAPVIAAGALAAAIIAAI